MYVFEVMFIRLERTVNNLARTQRQTVCIYTVKYMKINDVFRRALCFSELDCWSRTQIFCYISLPSPDVYMACNGIIRLSEWAAICNARWLANHWPWSVYMFLNTAQNYICLYNSNKLKHMTWICKKVKVSRNRPRWPKGVPVRLRPRIFLAFRTTRVVGRQPYAPAAFTPGEIPGTHF